MKNNSLLQKLQQSGGYLPDTHVELTNGEHCDTYLNKDLLISNPKSLNAIAEAVLDMADDSIEVVCGPPAGGMMLAEAVALAGLSRGRQLCISIVEKYNRGVRLKRGHSYNIAGKRVLLVDDVVKSGKTIKEMSDLLSKSGAEVSQMIVLVNWRGFDVDELGSSIDFIEVLPRPNIYQSKTCSLCTNRMPLQTGKSW